MELRCPLCGASVYSDILEEKEYAYGGWKDEETFVGITINCQAACQGYRKHLKVYRIDELESLALEDYASEL